MSPNLCVFQDLLQEQWKIRCPQTFVEFVLLMKSNCYVDDMDSESVALFLQLSNACHLEEKKKFTWSRLSQLKATVNIKHPEGHFLQRPLNFSPRTQKFKLQSWPRFKAMAEVTSCCGCSVCSHPRIYNFLFRSVSFPDNTEYTRGQKLKSLSWIQYWPVETSAPTDPCEKRHEKPTMPDSPFYCTSSVINPLLGITYFSNRSEL